MQIAGFIVSILGAGVVFTFGFQQATDALTQFFDRTIRNMLQSPGHKPHQGFFTGFISSILTGGVHSVSMTLWSLVDSGRITRTRGLWILSGMYPGSLFFLGMVLILGFQGTTPLLGFLFLGLGLMTELRSQSASVSGILKGLGFGLLGLGILNGYLQLIPYSFTLANTLRGFFSLPYAGIVGFVLGSGLTLLFRAPLTLWFLAASLGYRGWIPPEFLWTMILGGHCTFPFIGMWVCRVYSKKTFGLSTIHGIQAVTGIIGVVVILQLLNRSVPFTHELPGFFYVQTIILYGIHGLLGVVFVPLHMKYAKKFFSAQDNSSDIGMSLRLVSDSVPESLNANLAILRSGLARMAFWNHEMLMVILNVSQDLSEIPGEEFRLIRARRSEIGGLAGTINHGLTRLVQLTCSPAQANAIARQQVAVQQLDKIAESCEKIMILLEKSAFKKYRFHTEGQDELFDFTAQVLDFLKYNSDFLAGKIIEPDWNLAKTMEENIDKARNKLKKRTRKYMEKSTDVQIKGELAFIDVIGHLEHIGDSCLAISRAVFASRY